jgi:hypothetical protein
MCEHKIVAFRRSEHWIASFEKSHIIINNIVVSTSSRFPLLSFSCLLQLSCCSFLSPLSTVFVLQTLLELQVGLLRGFVCCLGASKNKLDCEPPILLTPEH